MRQTTYFETVDICQRSHGGNAESRAAYAQGNKEATRKKILEAITEAGAHGLTVDELAIRWNVGNQTLSGRFSELKVNNLIQKAGTRPTRTGAMAGVYVRTEP